MDVAETTGSIPFQLQFDKPIPFQVKMAEWNSEEDLLAMVTDDSKVLLHRFNWQRLWTVSPAVYLVAQYARYEIRRMEAVEGEIDKLSMEEAGYLNCVSVPDGAPSQVAKEIPRK